MPNTLTIVFTSAPSTEPVEFPHPNTGVYVTGTQLANGTWQAVHTGVTKGTYAGLTGRLKNFPAVTATIAASGPVLNNVLTTPSGTTATAAGGNNLSVAVTTTTNQTAYRLLASDAAAGPFVQIYQGTPAGYSQPGLNPSQTKFYEWQYVGGGFYDDSAVSAVFSGVTNADTYQDLYIGDSLTTSYPGTNVLDADSYPTKTHAALSTTIWKTGTALGQGYPGKKTVDVQSLGFSYVSGLKLAGVTRVYVVIRAGINNLAGLDTVATTFSQLTDLGTAFFNAGILPIFCTTTIARYGPYAGITYQQLDALQVQLNARIINEIATLKGVGVIDLNSDSRLNTNDPNYHNADGIHENVAGRAVAAAMVKRGWDVAQTGVTGFVITGLAAPAPTVTAQSAANGAFNDAITLTGTNFNLVTGVKLGSVPVTAYTTVNATTITLNVPTGSSTSAFSVTTQTGTAALGTVFTIAATTAGTFAREVLIYDGSTTYANMPANQSGSSGTPPFEAFVNSAQLANGSYVFGSTGIVRIRYTSAANAKTANVTLNAANGAAGAVAVANSAFTFVSAALVIDNTIDIPIPAGNYNTVSVNALGAGNFGYIQSIQVIG